MHEAVCCVSDRKGDEIDSNMSLSIQRSKGSSMHEENLTVLASLRDHSYIPLTLLAMHGVSKQQWVKKVRQVEN